MAKTTKTKGRRTSPEKLAAKGSKLSKNTMKKVKGGFSGGINWGDGSQTGFTPPFPG